MVIVITLILVSFIYVLCQLEDWRHFSNSREIASKTRSTDLIFVYLRACVRAYARFPTPSRLAHTLFLCDVEILYVFFIRSTFFPGFKLNTPNSFHLSQNDFERFSYLGFWDWRIEAVTFYWRWCDLITCKILQPYSYSYSLTWMRVFKPREKKSSRETKREREKNIKLHFCGNLNARKKWRMYIPNDRRNGTSNAVLIQNCSRIRKEALQPTAFDSIQMAICSKFICNEFGIHSHTDEMHVEMCNAGHHRIKNQRQICDENRLDR